MHDGVRRTSRRIPDLECECANVRVEMRGRETFRWVRVGLVFEAFRNRKGENVRRWITNKTRTAGGLISF